MVKIKTQLIIKLFIGIYIIQIILPLLLLLSIMLVKYNQHALIENYASSHHMYVTFEFSPQVFKNLSINKDEFIYLNNLYDIKQIENKDGHLIIKAIKDVNEKNLKLANEDLLRRMNKNKLKLLKAFQVEVTFIDVNKSSNFNLLKFNSKINYYYIGFPKNPYSRVIIPPPDFIVV